MSFSKAVDLLKLARQAAGRVGISLSEIEESHGCVRRTAQRMTQALEQVFPDTEAYVDFEGHKRWRIPRGRVAEFFAPTADQLAALDLARKEFERQGLSAEAAQLHGLADAVKLMTADNRRAGLEADEEALLEAMGHAARPGPGPTTNPDVDAAIAEALKGPFVLEIDYTSRGETRASTRRIEPYGLLLGQRRYLVGKDIGRADGRMRHYRVEDIATARCSADWFARDEEFDFARYAERAFGVFQDEREFGPVVWRFAPEAAKQAARFRFHPNQTQEHCEDGSLIVRFEASGHLEMCWHLYAWGNSVEVLEPPELASLVAGHQRSDFPGLP